MRALTLSLLVASLCACPGNELPSAIDSGPGPSDGGGKDAGVSQPSDGGDGGGLDAGGLDAGVLDAGSADGGLCAELAALPEVQGDLVSWLETIPIAASGSQGFVPPSAAELTLFETAFQSLVQNGSSIALRTQFDSLGYTLQRFLDVRGGHYVVLVERTPARGGGTYVVNLAPARSFWLEAPHEPFDVGTRRQSALLLVSLGPLALTVNGAHRCANTQVSSCSGTTAACGSDAPFRISDPAHYEKNYFTAAHRALRTAFAAALAVQIHGSGASGTEAAVLSNGTTVNTPQSVSIRMRNLMQTRLAGTGLKAFSCNDPADNGLHPPLCGTTNVQGRIDNQSTNVCTLNAPGSLERFLHIEQVPELRQAPSSGPGLTGEALADLVSCTLPGPGLRCPAGTQPCP